MNYINSIERYHEFQSAIHELLASIISGIAQQKLLTDSRAQGKSIQALSEHYPFVDLLYTLDPQGIQTSENITYQGKPLASNGGLASNNSLGKDRSQRPYFLLAQNNAQVSDAPVAVTAPYFSNASRRLCISVIARLRNAQQQITGYVVLDVDLGETVEFLMGDTKRRHFEPLFKAIYILIVLGLLAVVATLLHSAFSELYNLYAGQNTPDEKLKPFGVIIFLTLALAVFDLGKTMLEEEVLMHKDIFRHSSTRRTIRRFMAAILIAVSIEALLLMFKAALGDGHLLLQAVWMMMAAVALLIGLGLYIFLDAKAEAVLLRLQLRLKK